MTKRLSKSYDVPELRSRLRSAFAFGIESAHTDSAHRYRRSDTNTLAWSVTTKLGFVDKPWLSAWKVKRAVEYIKDNLQRVLAGDEGVFAEAGGAGDRFRDRAAGIGTTAHDAYDAYLQSWIDSPNSSRGVSAVAVLEEGCRKAGVEPKSEEVAACRSFDLFLQEHEIIPIASEIRVWYQKGKDSFAGTVDALFIHLTVRKGREGQKGIVDIEGSEHKVHDYTPQESGVWWCAACRREVEPKLVLGDHKTSTSIITHDDYALQGTAYAVAIEEEVGIAFDEIWVMRYSKVRAEYELCKVKDRKQAWNEFITISRACDAKESREKGNLLVPLIEREVYKI